MAEGWLRFSCKAGDRVLDSASEKELYSFEASEISEEATFARYLPGYCVEMTDPITKFGGLLGGATGFWTEDFLSVRNQSPVPSGRHQGIKAVRPDCNRLCPTRIEGESADNTFSYCVRQEVILLVCIF